jgi:hypothetical protein
MILLKGLMMLASLLLLAPLLLVKSLMLLLVPDVPGLSAVARDPLSLAYPLLLLADLLLLLVRNNPGTSTSIVTGVSSVVNSLASLIAVGPGPCCCLLMMASLLLLHIFLFLLFSHCCWRPFFWRSCCGYVPAFF